MSRKEELRPIPWQRPPSCGRRSSCVSLAHKQVTVILYKLEPEKSLGAAPHSRHWQEAVFLDARKSFSLADVSWEALFYRTTHRVLIKALATGHFRNQGQMNRTGWVIINLAVRSYQKRMQKPKIKPFLTIY